MYSLQLPYCDTRVSQISVQSQKAFLEERPIKTRATKAKKVDNDTNDDSSASNDHNVNSANNAVTGIVVVGVSVIGSINDQCVLF